MATLQTLDRGLKALFEIGNADTGVSISELAGVLKIDRAIAYRVVATLQVNGLVTRLANGNLVLGPGILRLETQFLPQFRAAARPRLETLANSIGATAFLSVADALDCVAVVVAEPAAGLIRVGYKVGSRHPLTRGAAGIAILSGRPATPEDTDAVRIARAQGFSITRGDLQKGAVGVACPVARFEHAGRLVEASVGVVAMEDLDTEKATPLVIATATDIGRGVNLGATD